MNVSINFACYVHSIVYNDMSTENNTMSTRIHTLKTHETWLQTNWILSINECIQVLILVINSIEILKYGICITWLLYCMNLNRYHTCSCNVYNSSICLSTACRRHRLLSIYYVNTYVVSGQVSICSYVEMSTKCWLLRHVDTNQYNVHTNPHIEHAWNMTFGICIPWLI